LLDEESLDALAGVQAEVLQTPLPLGDEPRDDSRKLAAFLEGFSLQAGTHVHERDREGLEGCQPWSSRERWAVWECADSIRVATALR
jgi:hypothetical protein